MKNKPLRLHKCPDCGAEFLSKYARKGHTCGHVARADSNRVEALKAQRAAAERRRLMGGRK